MDSRNEEDKRRNAQLLKSRFLIGAQSFPVLTVPLSNIFQAWLFYPVDTTGEQLLPKLRDI
jgi:uncharacterized membrane protein